MREIRENTTQIFYIGFLAIGKKIRKLFRRKIRENWLNMPKKISKFIGGFFFARNSRKLTI